jgi:hypothetical protein
MIDRFTAALSAFRDGTHPRTELLQDLVRGLQNDEMP